MDTKIKVVLILFVILAVGYAVYFIVNDFAKTKKKEKFDKRITETFEDYDVRKHILSQLDTYDIDKKTKNDIYESLNKNIEKFKEMPDDQITSHIKSAVRNAKSTPKRTSPKMEDDEEKIDETFENSNTSTIKGSSSLQDSNNRNSISNDLGTSSSSKNDTTSGAGATSGGAGSSASLGSTFGTIGAGASSASGAIGANAPSSLKANTSVDPPASMLGDTDIYKMIDSTSTQFKMNLNQIKGMVEAMAKQCQAPSSQSKPMATSTKSSPTIEGFENFGGKGYSFL